MIKKWLKNIGPAPLIAAAFIGPGTVTVCTLAGVNFGYALLWAMLLSIGATISLQEMASRLGIVTQKGLSEVIREELEHPVLRIIILFIIVSAIVVGNAAYEAGNITGGVLGLEALFSPISIKAGNFSLNVYSVIIGALAFLLLYIGKYKILEKVLITLVVIMSIAFLTTAILTKPVISDIFQGLLPNIPNGSTLTIIALIGTTVVPYNLFLHASLVKEKWHKISDIKFAKRDTIIAVALGGAVSMSIIISAATIQSNSVNDLMDLAKGLEPLFGNFAPTFLAIGLFAAGLTSAITAPLAAAYVASGCFGWQTNLNSKKFKAVWGVVLILGVFFSSVGIKPIEVIQFAQVMNGILLPLIAGLLLWVVNKTTVMKANKNSITQNIFGGIIVFITIFLGAKSILNVLNNL